MKELQDTDLMPFGKFAKTKTPMQDVPASYFQWLWSNRLKDDHQSPVADYIRRNKLALSQEYPDRIWS
jgi:hypothetical protein